VAAWNGCVEHSLRSDIRWNAQDARTPLAALAQVPLEHLGLPQEQAELLARELWRFLAIQRNEHAKTAADAADADADANARAAARAACVRERQHSFAICQSNHHTSGSSPLSTPRDTRTHNKHA